MPNSYNGFVIVDKPSGITSHDVLKTLEKRLGIRKLGHAGTLDPLATGVLIVLVGQGTRFQDFAMAADKVYEGEIQLGIRSDTDDITGEVTPGVAVHELLSEDLIRGLEKKFSGELMQVPPAYSAIKIDGRRAYDRARKGEDVKISARRVVVHELVLSQPSVGILRYRVHCSKGTYVRSLARDIGEEIRCGAVLRSIRRVKSGEFSVEAGVSVEDLTSSHEAFRAKLRPTQELVTGLPKVALSDEAIGELRCGIQKRLMDWCPKDEEQLCILFDHRGGIAGAADRSDSGLWKLRFMVPAEP